MLDRRSFLGAGLAGASALTFSSVWSQGAPNFGPPDLPSPGFRRMKLGSMEIIALNDGATRRPLGEEFVPKVPLDQVKALLAQLPTTQQEAQSEATQARRRQLLKMLAEIEQRIQHESARPRKHYVSPATREVPYALYYDALKRKIEARGTRHFPERNGQKLYGELTMILTVNSDGRVLTTEVVQPSGVTGLDRHAQAIATAAGPFGRFSREMRQQADQLAVVTRFVFARNNTLQTTSAAQER